uniref:NADH-ubiquinone oxidoreductase chain 2 n=1 Tax=Hypsauchenia hardwickii TaxID=2605027 RepID=A0A5B9TDS6_9HEMI|nr:NADH dehydrogenase subunit 2 [Hypsauchenia hardwickii]QEG98431.1 NADH dehydrogenase subunit 2 [Hypsauchenia hardwickii]
MSMNLEIMFNFLMMMGVIMAISSNNWFSMWLMLEVTLMCFLPIMSNKNKLNSESCIKYFIIQSLSSSIMMMGVIMMSMEYTNLILLLSLMLKLGVAPFHSWALSIVEGMQYYPILLFLTLTKLIPIYMLSYLSKNLMLIVIISLIIGSISGLIQNSMKKILVYSSVFNMALIMSSINNHSTWFCYYVFYCISLFLLITVIHSMNLNFINQLIFNNIKIFPKLTIWMVLLSMSGFPPFIGFWAKLIVLKQVLELNNLLLLVLMIMLSLIIMFFYTRTIFISLMFFSDLPKWMLINKFKFNSYLIYMNLIMPIMLFNLKS